MVVSQFVRLIFLTVYACVVLRYVHTTGNFQYQLLRLSFQYFLSYEVSLIEHVLYKWLRLCHE